MLARITAPHKPPVLSVSISGSKSISNRLLILKEVLQLNCDFINLSTAEDTKLLKIALESIQKKENVIDIHNAGTDMRFLTALLATQPGSWVLTGSERMKERPIGELVNALKQLGADIEFLEKENYPPLKINGLALRGGEIRINGGVSSQFISALLLISPKLRNGLTLHLQGNIVSEPYIAMTIELLKTFGVDVKRYQNTIIVQPTLNLQEQPKKYFIESDWSSSSYWYSICALCKGSIIQLSSYFEKSLQADSVLPQLFESFGVHSEFDNHTLRLKNIPGKKQNFKFNFNHYPDVAQTIACVSVGLNTNGELTGLETLRIKETDRISALEVELKKCGADVTVIENGLAIKSNDAKPSTNPTIATYNDHRMAMSFAPLAAIFGSIHIQNPEVVVKSYPSFWNDLKNAGFGVDLQP